MIKEELITKANELNSEILILQARLQYFIKEYQNLQQKIFEDVADSIEEDENEKVQEAE